VTKKYSQVVIGDMKTKYRKKKGMQFIKMDAKNMDFKDGTFDVVVDKALTDCLLCGDDGEEDLANSLAEISRVLKPGGSYVCVSFGEPECREEYFQSKGFNWECQKPISIPKPTISSSNTDKVKEVHWCYVVKKNE